ncbi:MAG: hypothetical protein CR993_01825 [Rhodobacterales bacterium]|nr:MAG: hypothetical protein CR993_01825 [Rhodobacterales bacterium]
MSNPESFIDEVTEAVRQDKLMQSFRKYGWIGAVLVLAIVGGAGVNEYLKAQRTAQAQAFGDAVLGAVAEQDAAARLAALNAIDAEGDTAAVLEMIKAAEGQDDARTALMALAEKPDVAPVYHDLARMKAALAPGWDDPEARIAWLEPLLGAQAGFRVLAEEQIALSELEAGRKDAAMARLESLTSDADAGPGQRQRVSQLLMALGWVAQN